MTSKRTPANERAKRAYLQYLVDVKGRDEHSLDGAAKAIERFDEYNRRRDFRKFHVEQARGFKAHLLGERNVRTGAPLSASTIKSTLAALKAFFIWLADQTAYRAKIRYADAEYFNLTENVARVAGAHRRKECPTLAQIRAMLDAMPAGTEVERRDRAIVAFTILTGARDAATISFRLKHIDLESGLLEQDAREVCTKRRKTFTTWFFPVGEDFRGIVAEWVTFLREEKGFGPQDPIFPKTRVAPGADQCFAASGLAREPWANAQPVRAIFREACARADLPYFNPHSFRNTIVKRAYELRLDAEQFKAWSQNLGHDHVLTTFCSYGALPDHRQGEIIRGLAKPGAPQDSDFASDLARRAAEELERRRSA